MKTYEVWATVWNDEYKCPVKKLMGTFDRYINAKIFSDAYDKHYSAHSEIRTVSKIEFINL